MLNQTRHMSKHLSLGIILFGLLACKHEPKKVETVVPPSVKLKVPVLSKDSAYAYVAAQVAYGPRVPGTAAHKLCGDWIIAKCKSFGAEVKEQKFSGQTYTGLKFDARNIIASYNPSSKPRIIIAAHWDTRFQADHDPEKNNQNKPVLGADDGGSGVGLLLEIARQLQANPISNLGIDLIFFDAEDQGGEGAEGGDTNDWSLGAQYWSKNKHVAGYQAKYGILFDMVGGKGPRFAKEGTSVRHASALVDKVWALAQRMGYGNYFVNENTSETVDDHYFINTVAGIPMIDIINNPPGGKFPAHWHTIHDDMTNIDPDALKAAGQVVLAVIYREANGEF